MSSRNTLWAASSRRCVALALLIAALGISIVVASASPVSNVVDERGATDDEFDFIVVGGGGAGAVIGARLSENPHWTVAIVEAGPSGQGNPNITIPGSLGAPFLGPLDWAYNTAPQKGLNGNSVYHPRGKILGGSTAINALQYTRPFAGEIDAWGHLGNAGWSWLTLEKYLKKAQNATAPSQSYSDGWGATFDPKSQGFKGPINVGFTNFHLPQIKTWIPSWSALGISQASRSGMAGDNVGSNLWPSTLVPETQLRDDTEFAYLTPNKDRKNLVVLANTTVTAITWKKHKSHHAGHIDKLIADGVTVVDSSAPSAIGAKLKKLRARKEVIISGGAFNSPAILEHSGIGNPEVLEPLGIPVRYANPGVGENLQDHPSSSVILKLKDNYTSLDGLLFNTTLAAEQQQLFLQNQTGLLDFAGDAITYVPGEYVLQTLLNKRKGAEDVFGQHTRQAHRKLTSAKSSSAEHQVEALTPVAARRGALATNAYALRHYAKWPQVEYYLLNAWQAAIPPGKAPAPGAYFSVVTCPQRPLARGSVHINSTDALLKPIVDPRYLSHELDAYTQGYALAFVRKLAQAEPLKSIVHREAWPGTQAVPLDASLQAWTDFARNFTGTEYHPSGSLPMLPLHLGGVVSPELRVYGTLNVRVVDASIFPILPSAHLQSVVAAVAEQAADIVKLHHGYRQPHQH